MYVDIRTFDSSEKASLDFSRHLPRRTRIGTVAILTERPLVFLSVIKKRWSKIICEVERQYASTLDIRKKESLKIELARLRQGTFSLITKDPGAQVVFAELLHIPLLHTYRTIYLNTDPNPHQLTVIASEHLHQHGLLVSYTQHPELYIQTLL